MMLIFRYILIFVIAIFATGESLSSDRIKALEPFLMANWQKVSASASTKYVQRLIDSELAELPEETKLRIADTFQLILRDELSWDKMGEKASVLMIQGCDDASLSLMLEFVSRKEKGPVPAEQVPAEYIDCVISGMVRASHFIMERIIEAQPRLQEALVKLAEEP